MIKTDSAINNIFCCPKCFSALKESGREDIICSGCARKIRIKQNIPVFTEDEAYWCNFPRGTMAKLNNTAEQKGYLEALREVIEDKEIRDFITEEGRVDPIFFLGINNESIVLDIGCKWGGLTIPFSDYCKTIVGVDTTFETIKFLEIRSRQLKKDNIHLAVASALDLPFKEASFDAVILNGVLEWLGYKAEFDATRDYGKKQRKLSLQNGSPQKMQEQGLKNILRVLKPGGALLIGIENRYALSYFMGAPEDHVNLKYVSLMPRNIADWYTRKKLNQEFRTYTYSMPALRKLLKDIGFSEIKFLAAFPSYREPDYIFSLENPEILKYFMKNFMKNTSKNILKRVIWNFLVEMGLYKFFVPSFLVIAEKKR